MIVLYIRRIWPTQAQILLKTPLSTFIGHLSGTATQPGALVKLQADVAAAGAGAEKINATPYNMLCKNEFLVAMTHGEPGKSKAPNEEFRASNTALANSASSITRQMGRKVLLLMKGM